MGIGEAHSSGGKFVDGRCGDLAAFGVVAVRVPVSKVIRIDGEYVGSGGKCFGGACGEDGHEQKEGDARRMQSEAQANGVSKRALSGFIRVPVGLFAYQKWLEKDRFMGVSLFPQQRCKFGKNSRWAQFFGASTGRVLSGQSALFSLTTFRAFGGLQPRSVADGQKPSDACALATSWRMQRVVRKWRV